MTTGYSAEFGQATGGVLNVITRSGANNLQGRVYGYYRSRVRQAPFAGRFTNGEPVFLDEPPPYHNTASAGFWGPLVKNRVFFFGGVESYANTRARSSRFRITGAPGRAGDHPGRKHQPRLHGEESTAKSSQRHRLSVRHSRTFRTDTNCSGQGGDGCNSSPLWTLEKRATFDGPLWSRARQPDQHARRQLLQRAARLLRREQAGHHRQRHRQVRAVAAPGHARTCR